MTTFFVIQFQHVQLSLIFDAGSFCGRRRF